MPAPRPLTPCRPATTTPPRPTWIKRGAVALDTATGRVGEIQHVGAPFASAPAARKHQDNVWLRPVGGGVEWESTVNALAPATIGSPGRHDRHTRRPAGR